MFLRPHKYSRTKRTAFNFASRFTENIVYQFARLLIWPIIVNGLGVQAYGAWNIILQSTSYLSLGNLRITSTLGLILSGKQHEEDNADKQKWIGAHIRAGIFILIALLLISLLLVWYAPSFFNIQKELSNSFQIALLVASILITAKVILDLPDLVLYASNQSFLGFIPRSIIRLICVGLSAFIVANGMGIIGLSIIYTLEGLLICVSSFILVRRFVSWFGSAKPQAGQVKTLLTHGLIYQIDSLAAVFTLQSSAIFLGHFVSLQAVAYYAITSRLFGLGNQFAQTLSYAVGPSFGDLYGRKEFDLLSKGWLQSVTICSLASGVVLGVIVPLNGVFISLWLGSDKYGGDIINILIGMYTVLIILQYPSAYILNQTLHLREKVLWSIPWLVLTLLLSSILVPKYQIQGMAATYLFATLFTVSIGYPFTAARICKSSIKEVFAAHCRPLLPGSIAALLGVLVLRTILIDNLFEFTMLAIVQGLIVCYASWRFGLSKEMRDLILNRINMILQKDKQHMK